MKILVVDDDKLFRCLVADLLGAEGYNVIEAENGIMALNILKKEKDIPLVITDVTMPEMNGFELVNQIRSDVNIYRTMVLMLTVRDLTEDQVAGYEYGADEYITKPFDNAIFIARVKTMLRRYQENKKNY